MGTHVVSISRCNGIVNLRLQGWFDRADADRAAADLHTAIRLLGRGPRGHCTLYDMRGLAVASSDTLAYFQTFFVDPRYASIWVRKVALVSGSALLRLQLQRIQAIRNSIAVFEDRGDAVAWLLAA